MLAERLLWAPCLAATQQLARVDAGLFCVLEGDLPVDHDPAIAFRSLHQA